MLIPKPLIDVSTPHKICVNMGRIKPEKLKAGQLKNYIAWLQDPAKQHTVGVGNGKDRPPSELVLVFPFNVKLPPATYAKATASSTAYAAMKTNLTGYVINALPAGEFAVGIKDYAAPRIVWQDGKATKGKAKTSHITGNDYNSYGGTSRSCPFGKSTATAAEEELQIFELIKAKFEVQGVIPAGQSVSLVKEKFDQRSQ